MRTQAFLWELPHWWEPYSKVKSAWEAHPCHRACRPVPRRPYWGERAGSTRKLQRGARSLQDFPEPPEQETPTCWGTGSDSLGLGGLPARPQGTRALSPGRARSWEQYGRPPHLEQGPLGLPLDELVPSCVLHKCQQPTNKRLWSSSRVKGSPGQTSQQDKALKRTFWGQLTKLLIKLKYLVLNFLNLMSI